MKLPVAFLCCLTGLCGCSLCRKTMLPNPVDSFAQALAARGDAFRLVRVIADFNNDGREDIAVIGTKGTGRRGGKWRLYLGNRAGFTSAGELYFDPRDSYLAPIDRGAASLIVFADRGDGRRCTEYLLKDGKLKERRSGPAPARRSLLSSHCNVFRDKVETCSLAAYVRARNCLWHRSISSSRW